MPGLYNSQSISIPFYEGWLLTGVRDGCAYCRAILIHGSSLEQAFRDNGIINVTLGFTSSTSPSKGSVY